MKMNQTFLVFIIKIRYSIERIQQEVQIQFIMSKTLRTENHLNEMNGNEMETERGGGLEAGNAVEQHFADVVRIGARADHQR